MNTILRNRRFRLILAVMAVAAAGALYYGLHVLDGERLVAEAKGLLAPAGTGTLQVESVGGNPLTGYRMEGVAYRREGGTVMTVREVTLRVSLAELLRGTLSLGRVTLEGVTVNLEGFPDFPLPERAALPLPEEILLMDAAFRSGTTQIAVTEARCTPEDRGLRLEGRGRFRDEAFRAEGTFSAGKGGVVLTGGRIAFDRGTLSASGPLLPQLQLRGRILGLPAATLLRLGGGHGSKLRGKVEGSFSISGPPEQLQAAGALILRDLEAETLSIPRCTTSWTYRRDILAFRDLQGSLVDTPVEGALSMDCSTPTPSLQLRLSGADVATEQLYPLFPWLDFAEGEADRVTVALGGPPGALTGRVHVEGYDGTVEGYRFTDLQGDFTVGPHRTGVNAAATWNKATLNARGSLPHDSDGARDLTIRSDTLYLHRAADSFPALAPLQLQGNAAATLHLGGTTGNPESRARFVSTAIRIRNVLLADTVLELGIAPGAIHVEEGRARRDGTPITLQGCIHTGETERLDLAIAADGAAPALLGSLPGFPWLESISGEGKARCRLTGPIDHPTYALQLQAPALDTPLGQLGEVRLKAAFDRSQLALDSCSATLGGGRLQLEGTLPLREGDGRLEGRLEGCRPAALSLPGSVTGTFTVSGSAAAPQVAAHLAVEEMSLPLLGRGRAELELAGGSEGLTVRKGLLTAENGRLDATGTLNPLEGTASLTGGFREVRLKATHAALEQIGLYPRGICSGRFSLQYDPEGLRLEADTTATEAGVNGIPLADCSWKATYDGETLTIDPLEARLAGGTLSAEASAESVRGNPGKGSFSASLEEIDLAELPRGILPRRVDLRGRASLECDGTWEDGSLALEGRAGIPALEIDKTARLEELALSFRYGGGEASASLTAGSGEGGVHASGSYDTAGNHWQGRVRMEEITLDRLLPGLPVTGTGDLHISAEAEADKLYTLEGTGELSLRDGSISGYAPIEAMAATSDRNALSFRHLQAGFALCGESLYILPGSRITAEGDNPLYHYLSLDGTLTLDGRIDINGYGTVNVTAMNAFFGALQEIVNAARTDNATEQEVINNMVSGLVTGLSTGDFRPVTFQLAGPLDSPSVNELHVAEKERYSGAPSLPGDSRIDRPHADRKIRLSLSIPAEGGVASGEVEQQLQDQIIDQLIRRLIPEQDHD